MSGNNKPGQTFRTVDSPDDLGRTGTYYAVGALHEAAKRGYIPADLWNQIMRDAARFEQTVKEAVQS